MSGERKIQYDKLTFILSVIGFIGSIGFYAGVLHEVYNPSNEPVKIEQLEKENEVLRITIQELKNNCDE